MGQDVGAASFNSQERNIGGGGDGLKIANSGENIDVDEASVCMDRVRQSRGGLLHLLLHHAWLIPRVDKKKNCHHR